MTAQIIPFPGAARPLPAPASPHIFHRGDLVWLLTTAHGIATEHHAYVVAAGPRPGTHLVYCYHDGIRRTVETHRLRARLANAAKAR